MPSYRLYLLDGFTGHITAVEELHSADDPGAIAAVTERERHVPMELWCGKRKVCRFDGIPDVVAYSQVLRPAT